MAGAREGLLFFFVRMLPSWHGRSGEWLVVVDDDKAGCWLVCAHTDSLHTEDAQAACADPGVGPGAAVKVSDPSVWGYRALLMWKCDDFSLCGLCIDQCPGNLGQQVVK